MPRRGTVLISSGLMPIVFSGFHCASSIRLFLKYIYDEVQHELKDIREPNVIWRVGGTD